MLTNVYTAPTPQKDAENKIVLQSLSQMRLFKTDEARAFLTKSFAALLSPENVIPHDNLLFTRTVVEYQPEMVAAFKTVSEWLKECEDFKGFKAEITTMFESVRRDENGQLVATWPLMMPNGTKRCRSPADVYMRVAAYLKRHFASTPSEPSRKRNFDNMSEEQIKTYANDMEQREINVSNAAAFMYILEVFCESGSVCTFSTITNTTIRKILLTTTNMKVYTAALPRIVSLIVSYQEHRVRVRDSMLRGGKSGIARLEAVGRLIVFILVQEYLKHLDAKYQDWFKANPLYTKEWDAMLTKEIEKDVSFSHFRRSYSTALRDWILVLFDNVNTVAKLFHNADKIRELQKAYASGEFDPLSMLASVALGMTPMVKQYSKFLQKGDKFPPQTEDDLSRAATPTPSSLIPVMTESLANDAMSLLVAAGEKAAISDVETDSDSDGVEEEGDAHDGAAV